MSELEGSQCAVTGAGGFVGQALCRRLVAEGATVKGLERNRDLVSSIEDCGASFVDCDVTDPAATAAAIAGCERVVHTAALVSDWGRMEDFIEVNVRGTRNVLDAGAAAGVARTVHLSSVVTWGYDHADDLGEDAHPRNAGIPYLDTKAASDALARGRAARGQPVTVVRPGDVYGPGSVPWSIRPLEAIRSRRFMLIDGGKGLILPIYIDDLIEAIVRALTLPQAERAAVTVWDGAPVSAAAFFGHYARMLGKPGIPSIPKPLAEVASLGQELVARLTGKPPAFTRNAISFVSRRALLSDRRARELLEWQPRVTLDEGMRRTEVWFREQGLL